MDNDIREVDNDIILFYRVEQINAFMHSVIRMGKT